MSASLTIAGGDALRGQLLGLAARAKPAIAAALYQEGQDVLRESDPRVPVKFGVLKGSAFEEPPVWTGDTCRVTLGYGGAASAYAAAVHERLHDQHPGGGGPKYLESVINEHEAGFSERIGAAVAKDLGL
jgi:hypothetical protein